MEVHHSPQHNRQDLNRVKTTIALEETLSKWALEVFQVIWMIVNVSLSVGKDEGEGIKKIMFYIEKEQVCSLRKWHQLLDLLTQQHFS